MAPKVLLPFVGISHILQCVPLKQNCFGNNSSAKSSRDVQLSLEDLGDHGPAHPGCQSQGRLQEVSGAPAPQPDKKN